MSALAVLLAGCCLALLVFDWRRRHELRALRTELEESQRRLIQAQKAEALGAHAGGVVHDFNNLLAAILGYAESVNRGLNDERTEHAMLQIQWAAERSAALTRRLLIFGRPEGIDPCVVDLRLLVEEVMSFLRRIVPADIELEATFEEPLPSVFADELQLEQVLINAVSNARDAMPGGGKIVIVGGGRTLDEKRAVELKLPAGEYVKLSVRDTGFGMSDDVLANAFEPFYSTKEEGDGTGLGLFVVQQIVEGTGGRVFVRSSPDGGTALELYLPAHKPGAATAAERDDADDPAKAYASSGECVLVVEDEEQVRELICSALRSAGYRVVAAGDVDEALGAAERVRPQLVVCDVVLPGGRGPDLMDDLRERDSAVSVVFVSGYAERRILKDARASGAPLLSKPFRVDRLLRTVRDELELSRAAS
ncbi:MAG: ATP-binding protein [Planctomycetota bacterium]